MPVAVPGLREALLTETALEGQVVLVSSDVVHQVAALRELQRTQLALQDLVHPLSRYVELTDQDVVSHVLPAGFLRVLRDLLAPWIQVEAA